MHEHEGFRPHGETRAELPAADEVDLRQVDERLRVQLVPNARVMPRRNRRPPAEQPDDEAAAAARLGAPDVVPLVGQAG